MPYCRNPVALSIFFATVTLSMQADADPNGPDVAARQGDMLWSEDSITIRGTWAAAGAYEWPLIDKSNATSIECNREAMRCLESRATFGRAKGVPQSLPPSLVPLALFYDAQSWSDGVVIASRSTGRLEIDARRGFVKLNWTQDHGNEPYFLPARQEFTVPIQNRYQTRFQGGTRWWVPYAKP